jgi:hypothetical protein
LALVPFNNAEDIGDRFLELLADLGIDVSTAIQAKHDFLSGTAAVEAWRRPKTLPEASDTQHELQAAAGLNGLAAKVMAASKLPDFQSFRLPAFEASGSRTGAIPVQATSIAGGASV